MKKLFEKCKNVIVGAVKLVAKVVAWSAVGVGLALVAGAVLAVIVGLAVLLLVAYSAPAIAGYIYFGFPGLALGVAVMMVWEVINTWKEVANA